MYVPCEKKRYLICVLILFVFLNVLLHASDTEIKQTDSIQLAVNSSENSEEVTPAQKNTPKKPFPDIYYQNNIEDKQTKNSDMPVTVETQEEAQKRAKEYSLNSQSLLLNNDIVAYYGHPNSKGMGILGRHPKEELLSRLSTLADEYKAASGGRDIIKAFYIIYATCWPEGNVGIISDERLKEYIDFAAENDMLVFLDHQIGKYDPVESLKRMLPYLRYPNVHLALDPEWRTTRPMLELGTVTADELNRAQKVMEEYIIENDIPGERLLVIHQFNSVMIRNRKDVKADFDRVRLVLCMDGHGSPAKKRDSYAFNAQATNIPVKAFKLFYNEKGNTGVDVPLLTPEEVYQLSPRPMLIMYQ